MFASSSGLGMDGMNSSLGGDMNMLVCRDFRIVYRLVEIILWRYLSCFNIVLGCLLAFVRVE